MPNNNKIAAAPVVAAAAASSQTPCSRTSKDKTHKNKMLRGEEEEPSSRLLGVVTRIVRKPKDIVGWDDVLCRPIYASSLASSTTRSRSSPLMQSSSGSSSDDDDDNDDTDNDFSQETLSTDKKHETDANTNTRALSTRQDGPTSIRRRGRRQQRTFGIRRKRTLEEIELLEKLNDHDNDSRSITLVQCNNNNKSVHDDNNNGLEPVMDQQQLKESSTMSSNDAKSESTTTTTVPIFHRRNLKKAKTAIAVSSSSLSTNDNNNDNHGDDSNNSNDIDVFDFPQDDDDGNEQNKLHKTNPKVLKQPSARTSLGSARAFFEHLDRHCPILLQAVENENNANKNVSIAPGGGGQGHVKNANGRTRRLVSLRDASVAKAYQAYGQACRDTGVPPLSLRQFWCQRRMAIGKAEHGDGASEALYDGFLDEAFE